MSTQRQRLSWDEKASAHPATPDEGAASPAHTKDDPGVDDYKNGDTSSWAEDPHGGPYPNSAHPATPDEGPASPAYKAASIERKAAKCIRLATAMLGDPEGDPTRVALVEDQALSMMNLSDAAVSASLSRLGMDEDEDEDEDEEAKKKASSRIAADVNEIKSRVARLERILIRLAGDDEDDEDEGDEDEEAKKKASDDDDEDDEGGDSDPDEDEEAKKKACGEMMDEEAMLDEMLAEEGMGMPDEEAMLNEMLAEEGMGMPDEEAMLDEMLAEEGMMDDMGMDDMAVDDMMADDMMMDDPMGVMATDLDQGERDILSALYGKEGGDDEDEDDDEEAKKKASDDEDEDDDEEAKKKAASTRPRPKKASRGAKKIGSQSKQASAEVDELSKLWTSAPDVSKHF